MVKRRMYQGRNVRRREYRKFVQKGGYMPFEKWDDLYRNNLDKLMVFFKKN